MRGAKGNKREVWGALHKPIYVCVKETVFRSVSVVPYSCSDFTSLCYMCVLQPAGMWVRICFAGWLPAGVQLCFLNSLITVAKGCRLEVLSGWKPGEGWHPVLHNEERNGAAGQARNLPLHISQTTSRTSMKNTRPLADCGVSWHKDDPCSAAMRRKRK